MAPPSSARIIAALFLVLPLVAAEPMNDRVMRTWRTQEGLPMNQVNALVQTRDGFLWAGTSGGLARFDGARFRNFGLQDGLRSVRLTALAEDQHGTLWIGTSGGGVSCWQNGRLASYGPEEGFPTGADVIALAPDRDGSMWIGTAEGLVHARDGRFTMLDEAQGLPRKQVRALVQDSQGTLWVSVPMEGLFCQTNGRFVRVEKTETTPADAYCLMEGRDGTICAGGNTGLLWRRRNKVWKRFDADDGLPKANIESLAEDRDGVLWMGVRNGGIYRSIGERFALVSQAEFPSQSVTALAVDREGSIWAGPGNDGLVRLSSRVLQYWDANAGLPADRVTSVAEDASGTWWVGTANKGIHRFGQRQFTRLEDAAVSADFPYIYCTAVTSDGAVWVAGEQCLSRFRAGEPAKAFRDPPIRGEAIRALCADGDTLWLGTYYSALLKADANGVQTVAPGGTFSGGITSIVREAADTLWIGTSAGLHRWERGQVKTWTTRDHLLTAYIRALHRDADGTLWIGTLGGGLARMKDGRFVHITKRDGLIDDTISQIVADDFGRLWLGSNRGIMGLGRKELNDFADGKISEVNPTIFDRHEGLLAEQCSGGYSPTAIKTRDGRLLFPTVGAIAEIDPRQLRNLTTTRPQAVIDGALIDGRSQDHNSEFVIQPGSHRVEFNFTAAALRGGDWVRFRYQLEGHDPDWIRADGARSALYDTLRPGHYTFRVAAEDARGNWTEPGASVAFTVQPFFWQTLWFRSGMALAALGLNGAWIWLRMRRNHLQRLAELERERRQHAELAHAGRVMLFGELSASIAHELKQPLTAILSNAQAAVRFLDNEPADVDEVRAILRDIVQSDRRASEIIGRMRAMMKKGEPQLEPRDLNADIEQVLTLLHSDLVTRQVTVSTQLASDLPMVRGDHIQLQQVLLNLVVNGCDAMQTSDRQGRRLVITTTCEDDDTVRVSIADRGKGIPPGMKERIFEPFYSTKESGLGMGLAICQTIVRAHGGWLWAENNTNGGATFHFTLKAEPTAAVNPHAADSPAGSQVQWIEADAKRPIREWQGENRGDPMSREGA